MKQFQISFRSFADIQSFVALSLQQPFEVLVGNGRQQANAKSLMGVLGLNFRRPLLVSVNCDDASFARFCSDAVGVIV